MSIKPHQRIDDFALDIQKAHTFKQLEYACIAYLHARGAKMMSYHHLPPMGAVDFDSRITIAAHGFPEAWVERYKERRYFEIDPIPKHAMSVTTPFWWSEAARIPGLSETAIAYLRDLTEAQLGDGLALPVFGPHGRNGYVGIGFGKSHREIHHGDMIRFQWACQLGHLKYCEMIDQELEHPVPLSQREKEIVHWVACGKSNSVISDILGITTYTVDTHMRRIYQKFGVADRVTAALRALSVGELS